MNTNYQVTETNHVCFIRVGVEILLLICKILQKIAISKVYEKKFFRGFRHSLNNLFSRPTNLVFTILYLWI